MHQELIQQLKDRGFRITKTRREILEIFCSNHLPLSATDVLSKVLENRAVNKTTIYREIWFLKEEGILTEITFGEGKARFELKTSECHHHLICEKCGGIEDVNIDDESIIKDIKTKSKFQTKKHSIEFFGLCINCQ